MEVVEIRDVLHPSDADDDRTLQSSWAYQSRIVLSAISVLSGIGVAVCVEPFPRLTERSTWLAWAIGSLLILAGIAVRLWAAGYLGGRKSREVVDVGPYSLCRNPLYVGTFLMAISQAIVFQSALTAIGIMIPLLVYVVGVVPAEERKLNLRLGATYDDYCRRVPRWWPDFRGYRSERNGYETSTRSFRRELAHSAVWILLPAIDLGILWLSARLAH